MRNNHLTQPYLVGSKNSKSLAIVIPSQIVKKYQISTSTVFVLKCCNTGILLSIADISNNEKDVIPVDNNSFEGYNSTGICY
jgi:inorganic pyrophosphatase/exopolyphosphatase